MVKAVRVHKTGGPEAMVYEDVEVGAPGPLVEAVRHRQKSSPPAAAVTPLSVACQVCQRCLVSPKLP